MMLNQSATAPFIPISEPSLHLHLLRLGPQAFPPPPLSPTQSRYLEDAQVQALQPPSALPFLFSPLALFSPFLVSLSLLLPFTCSLTPPLRLSSFSLFSISSPHLSSFYTLQGRMYTRVLGCLTLPARITVGTLGLSFTMCWGWGES